jgi:hypothetical protein
MGTDYPFDTGDYDPVGHVCTAGLDGATAAAICGGKSGCWRSSTDSGAPSRSGRRTAVGARAAAGVPQQRRAAHPHGRLQVRTVPTLLLKDVETATSSACSGTACSAGRKFTLSPATRVSAQLVQWAGRGYSASAVLGPPHPAPQPARRTRSRPATITACSLWERASHPWFGIPCTRYMRLIQRRRPSEQA